MRTEERAEAPSAEERPAESERIRRGLIFCLWVFVLLRVGLSLLALAGVGLLPTLDPVGVPGWGAHPTTLGWHNLVTAWERFDGLWFLRIADSGYVNGDGSAVFYPGYPMAVRAFSWLLGGHPLAGAFLVSHLATYGALVGMYFLTASEFGERTARRAVLYLAVFPTSLFLLAPYSESVFLAAAVSALWAARRGKWEIAGLAGAVASATRNVGVLIVVPLAVEAILQARERRDLARLARGLVWSGVAALGAVAYLGFWQGFGGDWLAPIHQQAGWQREFSPPWVTLVLGTREAFRFIGLYPGGYHLLDWLLVLPALAAAVWVAIRTRLTFGAYVWTGLLAPLSFVFLPRPFMSLPRFVLPLFPLFWAGAVWAGRRRGVHEAIVAISAAWLGLLTLLFVNWYYVF